MNSVWSTSTIGRQQVRAQVRWWCGRTWGMLKVAWVENWRRLFWREAAEEWQWMRKERLRDRDQDHKAARWGRTSFNNDAVPDRQPRSTLSRLLVTPLLPLNDSFQIDVRRRRRWRRTPPHDVRLSVSLLVERRHCLFHFLPRAPNKMYYIFEWKDRGVLTHLRLIRRCLKK